MKLLLDSNIVIDYIAKREPFYTSAERLILLGATREHDLWISTTQANDIFFVLVESLKNDVTEIKNKLKELSQFVHFCGLEEDNFLNALNSSWNDLEDACVYEVAKVLSADAIITRNLKDFKNSDIRVYDCDMFFDFMKSLGIEYDNYDID